MYSLTLLQQDRDRQTVSEIVSLAWTGLTDIGPFRNGKIKVIAQDWTSRQFIFRIIGSNRASRHLSSESLVEAEKKNNS